MNVELSNVDGIREATIMSNQTVYIPLETGTKIRLAWEVIEE